MVLLVNTVHIGNENGVRSHINVEVGLNIEFVHLPRDIGELFPVVAHDVVTVRGTDSIVRGLVLLLVLLHVEMVVVDGLSWLFSSGHGLRLHVDGDYQGGEGVSSDDSAVVHDILGSNFTVDKMIGL